MSFSSKHSRFVLASMRINLKEKLLQVLPESVPEDVRKFLCNLNEDNLIITTNAKDDLTMVDAPSSTEHEMINEIHQSLDEIYLEFTRMNKFSEVEKKHIEMIIDDLRCLSIKIIHSCYVQISQLKSEVLDLKQQIGVVESHLKTAKRSNLISELLSPLKKNIFLEMVQLNIPSSYFNVNILKSMVSTIKNDPISSEFYLNIHKMNNVFDEKIFDSFRNLVISISSHQNINFEVLLLLLIEKEKRNFEQHSMVTDFIRDSYRTNDVRLTTLLRQQEIISTFELVEIETMDVIYVNFFGHLFTRS